MEAPVINVGIMTHKAISFVFNEEYVHTETGTFTIGEQRALWVNGKIVYNGKLYQELFFEPTSPQSSFDLRRSRSAWIFTGNDRRINASRER